ncbi:hypothetical protein [Xylophilus sp. Leaf220]|uniref:hypothetical protein n=1 Tax=Xylophilus sp. Leaf220 TaxID=1735686 RepID=UPI0006F5D7E8|nr:hypothetical protein [Xylophilus sp. Leaf220]KQM79647.1 hypothetical protein ASE76_00035 [Xylophilus sp. Leaf220]
MNAFDLNDRIITAVGTGMAAAAERFGQRMQEIRERRAEQKASEHNAQVGIAYAKQVDDLTDKLKLLQAYSRSQAEAHSKTNDDLRKARAAGVAASKYFMQLRDDLASTQDILQRQSANSFALDEFRKLALEEMRNGVTGADSVCIDDAKRGAFLDTAWLSFMKNTNVKRGVRPLPPALDPNHRPFVPAPKVIPKK